MQTPPRRLLLISGSTRAGSTNTAALRTAKTLVPEGAVAVLYGALAGLPAFNPDDDHDPLPPAVAELRGQIAEADAVLFCAPEYAGTLPGSFKNLLDWTVGGGEMYGKPVGFLNVAGPGRGEGATATLRTVLGYVGAVVVEGAAEQVPVDRDAVGPDGLVTDPLVRERIASVCAALAGHAGRSDPA